MFHSTTSRDRHSKDCKEDKTFTYDECSKTFKRQANYKHHLAVHSGDFKLIQCQTCLKKYQSKTAFDAHISGKRCYPTTEHEQKMIRAFQKSQELEQIGDEELKELEKNVGEGDDSSEGEEDDSMEDVEDIISSTK